MKQELTKVEFNQEQVALIKNQIAAGASDQELALFIQQCKRTGLDPFSRQIYMLERRSKDKNGNWIKKMNIQVSIDGFRLIAQRSGVYAGQLGPYWYDGKEWKDVWIEAEPPRAAKVAVLRHDFKEPLWAVAVWESYAQVYNGKPTAMWEKMPDLMLAKVAESLALRKAFPNDLSGLYSAEEMAQVETKPETTTTTTTTKVAAPVKEVKPPLKNFAPKSRDVSPEPPMPEPPPGLIEEEMPL